MSSDFTKYDKDVVLFCEVPKGTPGAVKFKIRRPYQMHIETIWVDTKKLAKLHPNTGATPA